MNIQFKSLEQPDVATIVGAFNDIGWNNQTSRYQDYLSEQANNQRCIWVAFKDETFVGYVTLKWRSDYSYFNQNNIPEINDLNVLPKHRKQGVGSMLLDLAEAQAQTKGSYVGLGFGLYQDYGNAQKLYAKRGYIPDGHGITYKNEVVKPGSHVLVDDDLILWLIKKLN